MPASVKQSVTATQQQQPGLKASRSNSESAVTPPHSALCRYKTGRCPNMRAVKPNGALLLLCELHRSQQNRTKKRSDMKYRHDRARKRLVERRSGGASEEHTDDSCVYRKSSRLERYYERCSRRAAPSPPLSPLPTKRAGGMWPQDELRLLAYFLL